VYTAGHAVTSALFGFAASRNLRLSLVPTVVVSLAINHLDIDHVWRVGVDDGTINSLVTHTFHVYGGVPIFVACALAAAGLLDARWAVVLAGAYALHLAADALAYAISYSIPGLVVATAAAWAALALYVRRTQSPEVARRAIWFFFAAWWVCDLEAGFVHFVLGMDPAKSAIPWILPHVMGLAVWTSFAWLFRD
jgi:hypothetical protein